MMDLSEVRGIVNEHLKPIRDALQLQDWHIDTEYLAIGDNTAARIRITPRYRKALIQFDPAAQEDRENVLRNLRHELLHLVLAPFTAYGLAISELVPKTNSELDEHLFSDACELTVGNLERILDFGVPFKPWETEAVKDDA